MEASSSQKRAFTAIPVYSDFWRERFTEQVRSMYTYVCIVRIQIRCTALITMLHSRQVGNRGGNPLRINALREIVELPLSLTWSSSLPADAQQRTSDHDGNLLGPSWIPVTLVVPFWDPTGYVLGVRWVPLSVLSKYSFLAVPNWESAGSQLGVS